MKKLIITIYVLFIIKCLRYFYFSHNRIMGQDRLMLVEKELEYKNYPIVKNRLEKPHPDLYNYFISKYKSYIDNPKSELRLMQIDNNRFGYIDSKTEEILNYTFIKIDSIDNVSKKDLVIKASDYSSH